jgi:hypothetical protein
LADTNLATILSIVLGFISIIGSIVTIVTVINFIRFKVNILDEREKEFKSILEKTTKDLGDVINRLGIVVAEQAIINKFTANLLQTLTERQEKTEKLLMDYGTMINVIKEIMSTKKELK